MENPEPLGPEFTAGALAKARAVASCTAPFNPSPGVHSTPAPCSRAHCAT